MPKVTIAHYAIDLSGARLHIEDSGSECKWNYIKTQTLDRASCAGKGELRALTWLYERASNITFDHVYDPSSVQVKFRVSGRLSEKDYTYYILKYGHLHSISS